MPFQDILQAWTRDLRDALDRESLTVSDVRIGVVYTAAQLSEGSVGLAFTPRGMNETVCCPHPTAEVLSAGRLAGQNAWVLAESGQSAEALRRAVGVATLNALSALTLARRGLEDGRLLIGADALEAAEVRPEDRVAMVGAFSPFLKVLKERVRALWVIEKHLQLLKPDEKHFWCPPEEASSVLREATVVILTGSTLVEGGTEEFLEAAGGARRLVMAGPTTPIWPPTFFARGVDVLGGLRVTDGPKLLQIVSEGGGSYHFGEVAEKVCVVRMRERTGSAISG